MFQWVKETALKKWGEDIDIIQLNELMEKRGQRVCIVGALLKSMKLQPSVLREVSEDLEMVRLSHLFAVPLIHGNMPSTDSRTSAIQIHRRG